MMVVIVTVFVGLIVMILARLSSVAWVAAFAIINAMALVMGIVLLGMSTQYQNHLQKEYEEYCKRERDNISYRNACQRKKFRESQELFQERVKTIKFPIWINQKNILI